MAKTSARGLRNRQLSKDKQLRKGMTKAGAMPGAGSLLLAATADSFVNFAQKMGIGADSPLSSASYGFNPITRIRTMLEWIHRGSWLGGIAIDVVAEDMTRAGVDFRGDMKPEDIEAMEEAAGEMGLWSAVCDTIKWGRLYGGALAVMLIDGQNVSTPLRLETIGKDQFKGLLVLDRWMVDPSLNDLVTEMGPHMGQPKFYTASVDAPGLRGKKIHYSRCLRAEGIKLPYWQRVMENLWGISVIERLYDRMVAFDSATTGAAQLVYKSFIRTYRIKDLTEIIAAGGAPMQGLMAYVELMRKFQGNEGITLIDAEDDMATMHATAFSGLSDVILQMGQQLSGALQVPMVRLFGQSPVGLNSSGESDLRTYYDGINKDQKKDLQVPMTRIFRALAASKGIKLPKGFGLSFRSLWQMPDKEKAEIAETVVRAVKEAEEAGLITQQGAMKELQQSSSITGIFTNITDKDIKDAEDTIPPPASEVLRNEAEAAAAGAPGESAVPGQPKPKKDKADKTPDK